MREIAFAPEDKAGLVEALRAYCNDELEAEVSGLQAGFFLDWIAREMGPAFYNQGVLDAKAVLDDRLEEALDGLLR